MGTYHVTVYGQAVMQAFARKHPNARKPLARFEAVVTSAEWRDFPDLKQTFPSADYTPATQTVVIDIGGHKYRLLTRVDFEQGIVDVQAVMTHKRIRSGGSVAICPAQLMNKCSPRRFRR